MDAIMRRRSTRKFMDNPVEREKLERILRAAMQSPTGHNAQEWEFLVVEDEALRLKISEASPETSAAKNAPINIVLLVNQQRCWKDPADIWVSDMGAVAQTILIQAEAEGLGSVWLSCWPYPQKLDYMKRLLELPEQIIPYAIIPIGYKAREKPFDDRWDSEKVHWGRYGCH